MVNSSVILSSYLFKENLINMFNDLFIGVSLLNNKPFFRYFHISKWNKKVILS